MMVHSAAERLEYPGISALIILQDLKGIIRGGIIDRDDLIVREILMHQGVQTEGELSVRGHIVDRDDDAEPDAV